MSKRKISFLKARLHINLRSSSETSLSEFTIKIFRLFVQPSSPERFEINPMRALYSLHHFVKYQISALLFNQSNWRPTTAL